MATRYTVNDYGNPVQSKDGMWVTYEAYHLKERQLALAMKLLKELEEIVKSEKP